VNKVDLFRQITCL